MVSPIRAGGAELAMEPSPPRHGFPGATATASSALASNLQRTAKYPHGSIDADSETENANACAYKFANLVRRFAAANACTVFSLENPEHSLLWELPCIKRLYTPMACLWRRWWGGGGVSSVWGREAGLCCQHLSLHPPPLSQVQTPR